MRARDINYATFAHRKLSAGGQFVALDLYTFFTNGVSYEGGSQTNVIESSPGLYEYDRSLSGRVSQKRPFWCASLDYPSQTSIIVIIPARNEEKSIGLVIREIPREWVGATIVVDNGSTDTTAEVARAAGATVLHEPRRGYGYACLLGIRKAMEMEAEIIVFLDGDLSDYPEELPQVVAPIVNDKADLVIGSRATGQRASGSMTPQALFGNWLASRLIRLFWGVRFTDLGPFRAIRVGALRQLRMSDPTYGWTVEMQIKAAKLGLHCVEVPVRYRRRIGKSKVSGTVAGTIGASAKILYTIGKYIFVRA